MENTLSASVLPRLLTLLLLLGAIKIQTRCLASPVNQVFHSNDNPNSQNRLLAFLLQKGIMSMPEDAVTGLELVNKITKLHELTALQEELREEKRRISEALDKERLMPSKRDEACFWKYCV